MRVHRNNRKIKDNSRSWGCHERKDGNFDELSEREVLGRRIFCEGN